MHAFASKAAILRDHVMRLYEGHVRDGMIPTSIRFLFYELIVLLIIPKHASGVLRPGAKGQRRPDQNLIEAVTWLRERDKIPWSAIVDETRSLDDFTGWESIKSAIEAYLAPNVLRLDPWGGKAPLVLTESRSLAGVLRELLRAYAALIAPTNGQTAGFLHNDVAPMPKPGQRVIYLGDYDLVGGDIEDHTRAVLERYCRFGDNWERLALTRKQVDDYSLPIIIKRDARFKNGGEHEAVETEALSQRLIVQIVRDRLDALLPEPLAVVEAGAEAERERLRRALRGRDQRHGQALRLQAPRAGRLQHASRGG